MRFTQFLIFELGPACNLADVHAKCPCATRASSKAPGAQMLTDDQIVATCREVYQRHDFMGLIGFHFYNEPLVYQKRMFPLMEKIREAVPRSRFILWTNGTIQSEDQRMSLFEQVHCSDYSGQAEELRAYFKKFFISQIDVFNPHFDDRLQPANGSISMAGCQRPLIELIFDCYGEAYLCCQDWRGEIKIGNLQKDSIQSILQNRQRLLDQVCHRTMQPDAPTRCLKCQARIWPAVHFDASIAQDALAHFN